MPQKDLQYWGRPHLPQGPIQWWQWSLSPFWPQIPNSIIWSRQSHLHALGRRCRSNQLNHATEGPPVGTPTCPRTHPVVAGVVSCEPILAQNHPKFNHLSRPKPSPCVGADVADQINSIMPEGPPVLGSSHLPQGPIQWWQWSLSPFWPKPPIQSFCQSSKHLHALEQTLQIKSTIMPQEGPPVLGGLPPAPGTHPVAVVSEAHFG
jgi:hypothetical protein